jgi:hypothetical protein
MGRFLDLRISENSSTFGSPLTALVSTPTSIGVIGLQTKGVAGVGAPVAANGLIVNLAGTVGVSTNAAATIILNVQRGAGAFGAAGAVVIYTADHLVSAATSFNVISITAADVTAPAAAETVYQLFIRATFAAETLVTRVGPETFMGIAQDGLAATP